MLHSRLLKQPPDGNSSKTTNVEFAQANFHTVLTL